VTVADDNNDGFEGIFIACRGRNVLCCNNGGGTFTGVAREAGLRSDGVRWPAGLPRDSAGAVSESGIQLCRGRCAKTRC
jgi:hypothetical protein